MQATLTPIAEQHELAKKERRGIEPAKRKGIVVLTPTLGVISMWWHTAAVDLIFPMNTARTFVPLIDRIGGEVGQMRNQLISMALGWEKSENVEIESVLWIDDDVIVNRAVLLQLGQHDVDIASGVYFCKGEPCEPLIFDGPSSGCAKFVPNELTEHWGWAQGLSLVKLEVYKRMAEDLDLGKDKYGNPQWYKQPEFGRAENGMLNIGGTEDFHFFDNCSKLGYRALVDSSALAFGWHYSMTAKTAYPTKQWEQYVRREPIVWPGRGGRGEVVWA